MASYRRVSRRGFLSVISVFFASLGLARASETMLSFAELYESFGVMGLSFSARAKGLIGAQVTIAGYMAPPLKAESHFFVLTKEPLAICPFCQSDADWPVDIVVIYLDDASPLMSAGAKLAVTGRLELGSWTDPESGFVSQVRLRASRFRRL